MVDTYSLTVYVIIAVTILFFIIQKFSKEEKKPCKKSPCKKGPCSGVCPCEEKKKEVAKKKPCVCPCEEKKKEKPKAHPCCGGKVTTSQPCCGGHAAPKTVEKKVEEKKKVEEEEDDDDDIDDMFGSDNEGDDDGVEVKETVYSEEMQKKIQEVQTRLKKKEKKSKSLVVFSVNPQDGDVDIDKLAGQIRGLKFDGLTWGINHQKKPFVFGMFQLLISCTIFDDQVNMNDVEDALEDLEDVSSKRIESWNKL